MRIVAAVAIVIVMTTASAPAAAAPVDERPSLIGAAFRQDNLIFSAIARFKTQDRFGEFGPDHDPMSLIVGTHRRR